MLKSPLKCFKGTFFLKMKRIGILSDTHGHFPESLIHYFAECDEIWHAGDFGTIEVSDRLAEFKPLRGVYGNIDGTDIRSVYPEKLHFSCEGVRVFMQHIGGYPNKYAPGVTKEIRNHRSGLFISGHSHILKIMYDEKLQCLHMNPGAAGKQGWHKIRTIIRFVIDQTDMKDCEVIEL